MQTPFFAPKAAAERVALRADHSHYCWRSWSAAGEVYAALGHTAEAADYFGRAKDGFVGMYSPMHPEGMPLSLDSLALLFSPATVASDASLANVSPPDAQQCKPLARLNASSHTPPLQHSQNAHMRRLSMRAFA